MAQNYKYKRTINSKFNIKGEVTEDGDAIKYVDGDGQECIIAITDCFRPFRGDFIDLSLAVKDEEDLTEEFEGE